MIEFDEILKVWKKSTTLYGWIDPAGNIFFGPNMYGHFNLLKNDPDFEKLIKSFETCVENYEEDSYQHTAHLSSDDHPCWHAFSSDWEDIRQAVRSLIIAKAYEKGWLRFALNKKSKYDISSFEGFAKYLNRRKKDIDDLSMLMKLDIRREIVNADWSAETAYLRNVFDYFDRVERGKKITSYDVNYIELLKGLDLYEEFVKMRENIETKNEI